MGLIKKLRRHAAMAGGDFGTLFKGIEIAPLPIAVQRLVTEINKENPDIDELAKVISAATDIAAKVIQTVNSSYYSPRSPVKEIKQAVMFLGLKNIRSMTMAYAAMEAIPKPEGNLFDHEAFWIDSLLRAFLSRSFAVTLLDQNQGEEAFTASLIADVALPVLLCAWGDYYAPLVDQWSRNSMDLSSLERNQLGWDHAQAGAWIIQSWGFPEELVCYIGAHNLSLDEIKRLELEDTIVVAMAIAAQWPSVLRPNDKFIGLFLDAALPELNLSPSEFAGKIRRVQTDFAEVLSLFGLSDRGACAALEQLIALALPADKAGVA